MGGAERGSKERLKIERRSAEELDYLEKSFIENPLPTEARRQQIGQILGLPERKVMIWFQNKRQRMKQKMKVAENANLKEENAKLQRTLVEERARGLPPQGEQGAQGDARHAPAAHGGAALARQPPADRVLR